MVGGFTFDGVDIADIGLEYAPDNQNTYTYNPATYTTHDQKIEGHDGGYYYGATVQPKDFILRCIYEDSHISGGIMERIHHLFRRGRTGRLIFQRRPWCWYTATVVNVDTKQMTNYQNGVITVTLRAYYPFARTDYINIPANDDNKQSLINNTALVEGITFNTNFPNITHDQTILLYNPGTERAKVAIRIAGDVGTGAIIANNTTGQSCRFVAITPELTSGNYYVQSDALNGQTVYTNGTQSHPGFLYHDYGFIELEPGFPAYRDINVTIPRSGTEVRSNGLFKPDMVGRYIYFANGTSAKIVNFTDENSITVNTTVTSARNGNAQILKMNELRISSDPAGGVLNLTRLDFVYKPTFA